LISGEQAAPENIKVEGNEEKPCKKTYLETTSEKQGMIGKAGRADSAHGAVHPAESQVYEDD
jgi:hypothetical protein